MSLRRATTQLVAEYQLGVWPELLAKTPKEAEAALLVRLLERCPGHSTREYRVALRRALQAAGHTLGRSRLDPA